MRLTVVVLVKSADISVYWHEPLNVHLTIGGLWFLQLCPKFSSFDFETKSGVLYLIVNCETV